MQLINNFPSGSIVDLVDAFTTRLPVNVIVDMLGMDQDDHDRFHTWYTTMMAGLARFNSEKQKMGVLAVSYTHLTLPTKRIV